MDVSQTFNWQILNYTDFTTTAVQVRQKILLFNYADLAG